VKPHEQPGTAARLWILLFMLGGATGAFAVGPEEIIYHVAVNGRDSWSGLRARPAADGTDGPFRSLERARGAVRAARKQGRAVRVLLHEGVWRLSEPFVLSQEDSGAPGAPVTWEAAPGAAPVVSGGWPVRGWRAIGNGVFRARVPQPENGRLFVHQLFYRGKRQTLARYPNADPRRPRTGGFLYVLGPGARVREQFIIDPKDAPLARWKHWKQAEVCGMSGGGWTGICTPVTGVDAEKGVVSVRPIRYRFYSGNRVWFQNMPELLDAPGEWFLDYDTGELLFKPPDGRKPGDGEVVIPVVDSLFVLQGSIPYAHQWLHVGFGRPRETATVPAEHPPAAPVEYIVLRGIRFECARQHGVVLSGVQNCGVIGCAVTGVGGVGINLGNVFNKYPDVGCPRVQQPKGVEIGVGGAGQDLIAGDPCRNCRVAGNDVWDTGADGIFLYGVANIAENNHVWNIGLFDKDCAAINLFGERNEAVRNTLHHVPRNAVFLKGINNAVTFNDIRWTMLETCDGGAIRMCQRNVHLRGNRIVANRIRDTVGYGYDRGSFCSRSPWFSWGVYLDDFTCGTEVTGNFIARTGRAGVHIHGGSDNHVAGNIIVDAGEYGVELNPIRNRPSTGNCIEHNVLVAATRPFTVFRCGRWVDRLATFDWNLIDTRGDAPVFRIGRDEITGLSAWRSRSFGGHSRVARAPLRAPERDDVTPTDYDLLSHMKIPPFDTDRVGCFESPERRMWPVRGMDRPPEKPVAYRGRPAPVSDGFEALPPGGRPMLGSPDVHAPPPSRVFVTRETAAEGKQSLKFVDAPGVKPPWTPRIFYPMHWERGLVHIAFFIRLSKSDPPSVVVDFRQYSDAAPKEYISGVSCSFHRDGTCVINRTSVTRVPLDTWVRLEFTFRLADRAAKGCRIRLHLPGVDVIERDVQYASDHFRRLERVVICSGGDASGVWWIDDVQVDRAADPSNL